MTIGDPSRASGRPTRFALLLSTPTLETMGAKSQVPSTADRQCCPTVGRLLDLLTPGYLILSLFLVISNPMVCAGQTDSAIRFSPESRVFRIDAGETTYAFGVNEKNELQSIYWGGRLREGD